MLCISAAILGVVKMDGKSFGGGGVQEINTFVYLFGVELKDGILIGEPIQEAVFDDGGFPEIKIGQLFCRAVDEFVDHGFGGRTFFEASEQSGEVIPNIGHNGYAACLG